MNTYARLPVSFVRGEGAWLFDDNGKRYLDGLSGIAVCGLGHAHPAVTRAICEQAGALLHVSNLFEIPHQRALGERLCELAGMDRAFFTNSGAEANEAAIKLARLAGSKRGIKTPTIIVMEAAFHGRTMATLTASGNRKIQAGFEPLVSGFVRAPYGDAEALAAIARNNHDIVAVLVEPVQGEAGIVIPPAEYLASVRQICDDHGWLMMLDEVQTGNGRTGAWFACQRAGVQPDVLTTAKGLGNGVPIGACLARGDAAEVLGPGNHGTTFGGNPLACRAALAVLEVIEQENLCERARSLGERIAAGLRDRLAAVSGIRALRGYGLMFGIELDMPCSELAALALERGLVINVAAGNVIRLLPPLIMSDDEADELVDGVASLVIDFMDSGGDHTCRTATA